jgi:hypothetical protein
MLIQAFEVKGEKRVDVFEGDYPDDSMDDLRVGIRIPLELNHVKIGEYEIIGKMEKRTEIDVPYVELIVTKVL